MKYLEVRGFKSMDANVISISSGRIGRLRATRDKLVLRAESLVDSIDLIRIQIEKVDEQIKLEMVVTDGENNTKQGKY